MNLKRNRYQNGSLTIEKRKTGPSAWVYRWRTKNARGQEVRRKIVLGTKTELPTKTAALKHIAALALDINTPITAPKPAMTVAELVDHYRKVELAEGCNKTTRTIAVYEQHIRQYILPQWGGRDLTQVKPVLVEAWLRELARAPATKAKLKNVLGSIFQHACRYEFITTNPVRLVRQSSARVKEPEVLTPEEVRALLNELDEPVRTIVHVAATTGIRRGELFGLKWMDLDVSNKRLKIVRSIVDQEVGATKTTGSKRPLPVSEDVLDSLLKWREKTDYGKDADWVFASPQLSGERPYWPNALMLRQVLPAADRAGITKRIGWHTFRHTFATLLQASGAGVRVSQELLRHNSPTMTLGTYTQAVTEEKRLAQARVAALFGETAKQEAPGTTA